MKISILIPCYNEEKTLRNILQKVIKFEKYEKEIIIIDDASNDKSYEIAKEFEKNFDFVKTYRQTKNIGKGSAIKSGLEHVTGDIVLIQDADLEYDPIDYPRLLEPFENTDADVVYGSRFLGGGYVRLHFYWHSIANKLLTTFSNILTNLNMTDMETGYKLFKTKAIKSINLKEKSFSIEPEITVKLAKKKFIFYEVPISYKGRSYEEGKKITFKDAFFAIFSLIKYRFFD